MSVFILPESNAKHAFARLHFTTRSRSMTGGAVRLLKIRSCESFLDSFMLHDVRRCPRTGLLRNRIRSSTTVMEREG